jgi:acyl transferase domain-containing protein
MSSTDAPVTPESIAIIGMSGRFPKADNLEQYWRNLRDGIECISFFSDPDPAAEEESGPGPGSPLFVSAGGVLEGMDLFDAPFFGLSARDAEGTDPQQRVFLECAWHSLEAAGYNPETYPGLIGVFAGAALSFYLSDIYTNREALASFDDLQLAIGNDKDHLTTQVSYKLNLRGPSLTVQTACSTSLVTVCMACQSLLDYQCDMALAGGVSADITPTSRGYYHQPGGILSPDGHCRSFDAAAQGTVAGNGVGIVVLKRLSEALADRDHIRGIIKGFALNNDGSRKVGYTAPSVDDQAEVVAMAHAMAGVEPETITFIEAHGTGTPLGDPIEVAALDQVFGASTSRKGFCAIGSVKSNIGHLDTAAGVAGLIKAVLALEHKLVPPTLHVSRPNPKIDFEDSAFYVNTQLSEWRSSDGPRRAGVSSFGIGGTNAHVVLEEAPPARPSQHRRPCCLLPLSARSSATLEALTDRLAHYLSEHPDADLGDVAYTCQVGRKAFEHRRVLIWQREDTDGAASALEHRDPQRLLSRVCQAGNRPLVFMFPGQGTQGTDMALEAYQTEPAFRKQVDRCCEILGPQLGLDLRELLYPEPSRRSEAALALGRTAYTQAALFTIEYALAQLWMEWGVQPYAMIGHSIGEYVAACLAEVFSLEDALRLVAIRGQLMDRMPSGAMLAVPLPELAIQPHLGDALAVAAVNGPDSCVVAGPAEAVERLAGQLAADGTRCHRLRTSHAFHSSMMEPVVDRLIEAVQTVRLHEPQIPFISNVTGTWITGEAAMDPRYWGAHLRQPVRFSDGLRQLFDAHDRILLEVGPGQTLGDLARQHPDRSQHPVLATLPSAASPQSDIAFLVSTLGTLWLHGVTGDWAGFNAHSDCQRVPLPTYPFARQRYWIGPAELDEAVYAEAGIPERYDLADWFYYPAWKPAPPDEASSETGPDAAPTRWLVFDDQTGLGAQLIDRLRAEGHQVSSVVPGANFTLISRSSYAIRPDVPEDYERLLKVMAIEADYPGAIAHLWNVTELARQGGDPAFERLQRLGFYSLTSLVQALMRLGSAEPLDIALVSNHMQAVTGDEPLCPAKATVLGPCRVIPQEHPHISCRVVDIDYNPSKLLDGERIVEPLFAELTVAPFEPAVAYRKGRRWVQAFEPVRIEDPAPDQTRTRQGGVYVITGGMGSIGLVIAEFLARTARAKLVLTGRSPFPEPIEWERWLEIDPECLTSQRIRKLLELQEGGSEVIYLRADSADKKQMRRVVRQTEARFGAINGVIHGAGDTEANTPVDQLDRAVAERQFRPKANGLNVLEELLRGKDLDFCLLLSSLSSILGGIGLAAYAAANCFLDARAGQLNRKGSVPWISVNWDAWHFPDGAELGDSYSAEGASFILPWDGEEAFKRILARAPRQVIVSTTDLTARYGQWVRFDGTSTDAGAGEQDTDAPAEQGTKSAASSAQHSRPDLANPYVPPRTTIEQALVEIWQQLLGIAPIGAFDNFFELGGHSLRAVQLVSRLQQRFVIDFPVQGIFEHPTIAELAERIKAASTAAGMDDTRTAELLDFVEQLSAAEVQKLLDHDDDVERQRPADA